MAASTRPATKSAVSSSNQTNSSTISATSMVMLPLTSLRSAVMKTGTPAWRSRSLCSSAAACACELLPSEPRVQLRSTARSEASKPTIASPSSNESARTTSQLRVASAAAMLSAARPRAVSSLASASSTISTRGRRGPGAGVSIALLLHAVDQPALSAVRVLEAQTMDVRLEAGEMLVGVARVLEIVDDRVGLETLAGHDQRDARRVGHDHHRCDTGLEFLDGNRLHPSMNEAIVGVRRLHRRLGKLGVHRVHRVRGVVLAIALVQGLAQVAQSPTGIGASARGGDARQGLGQGRVLVVVGLEVDQRVDHRGPFAARDAERKQDQEAV